MPSQDGPDSQMRRAPARLRHPFETLRQEIDRFIHTVDQAFAAPTLDNLFTAHWPKQAVSMVDPAVDIVETEGAYELRAELPGLAAEDVEIVVEDGLLHLKGEKRDRGAAKSYFLHERQFGTFARAFRVPDGVDSARIRAVFKDGLLTVSLPRATRLVAAPRKIDIAKS